MLSANIIGPHMENNLINFVGGFYQLRNFLFFVTDHSIWEARFNCIIACVSDVVSPTTRVTVELSLQMCFFHFSPHETFCHFVGWQSS